MDSKESTNKSFAHQIILLGIGALLGFFPTFILSAYQARAQSRAQREQLLLEKRFLAFRDYSSALTGDGELFAKFEALERELTSAIANPSSNEILHSSMRLAEEAQTMQERYTATLKAQTIVLNSLFGIAMPQPEFMTQEIFDLPDVKAETGEVRKARLVRYEKSLRENTHLLRVAYAKYIKSGQEVMDILGQHFR
jgi:hypothetical protein